MAEHHTLVVGCGSIGERHARCIKSTGRSELSVCDSNLELLEVVGQRYGAATHRDFESALRDPEITAVVIATPAHLHVAMARDAIGAGKHVLIEKPLSTSLDGVTELIESRDESGKAALVAYTYRVNPAAMAARKFILGGDFGRPLHVIAVCGQDFPYYRPAYREIYFNDHETGGGAIQDGLTHVANTVEWILGPTDSLVCDAGHLALPGVAVEDAVNVQARNGGTLVSYAFNLFQAPSENFIHMHSKGGSVRIEFQAQRWGVWRRGDQVWTSYETPVAERDMLYVAEANEFLNHIEGHLSSLATLEEALQTTRFNLAALQSAQTGSRVRPESVL